MDKNSGSLLTADIFEMEKKLYEFSVSPDYSERLESFRKEAQILEKELRESDKPKED